MPPDPTHPDHSHPDRSAHPRSASEELEGELRLVERAIADSSAQDTDVVDNLVQASWLLIALGRLDPALAAAELAQTCWGIAKDANGSPYGGGLFWEAHRAAAVAHMSVRNWHEAETFLLDVLRDFAEEGNAFYLHELCRHAEGRRPPNPFWNVLKDPDRDLAAFDAQAYALEQYRSGLDFTDPTDTPSPDLPHVARWRGVPIPPALLNGHWTAQRIDAEPNPTIRACAIAVFGPERYARESELPADQRQPAPDPTQHARAYAWTMAIPRALGRPDKR